MLLLILMWKKTLTEKQNKLSSASELDCCYYSEYTYFLD